MRTHRFGRKIKLPASVAIKHRIRMGMAQHERERAEADTTVAPLGGKAREELPIK
jgi:hypothetical protein